MNLLALAITFPTPFGSRCSWRHRGKTSATTSSSKIMKMPSHSRSTVTYPPGQNPGTSTFVMFGGRTELDGAHHHPSLSHITVVGRFFTKPLQGNLFRRFKAVVLGHAHVDTLRKTMTESSEERVEDRQPDSADGPAQGYATGTSASSSTKATYAGVENRPSQQELSQNARTRNKILARNDSLARIPLI